MDSITKQAIKEVFGTMWPFYLGFIVICTVGGWFIGGALSESQPGCIKAKQSQLELKECK